MRTIEVIVSPAGDLRIDAVGFQGADCEKATAFLEQALGRVSGEAEETGIPQSGSRPAPSAGGRMKKPFRLDAAEIDWRLLRKQKRGLHGMLVPVGKFPANVQEAVSGIVNLLDYVQDEAATALGEKAVFGR